MMIVKELHFTCIADIQESFDADVKAGYISASGWNNSASSMGRLGYKLMLQTGEVDSPIDTARVYYHL